MNYRPEVSTDGGATFGQNAQVFATHAEAETMAKDIFNRWFAATHYRVTETEDPVNYRLVDSERGWVIQRVEAGNAVEAHG